MLCSSAVSQSLSLTFQKASNFKPLTTVTDYNKKRAIFPLPKRQIPQKSSRTSKLIFPTITPNTVSLARKKAGPETLSPPKSPFTLQNISQSSITRKNEEASRALPERSRENPSADITVTLREAFQLSSVYKHTPESALARASQPPVSIESSSLSTFNLESLSRPAPAPAILPQRRYFSSLEKTPSPLAGPYGRASKPASSRTYIARSPRARGKKLALGIV